MTLRNYSGQCAYSAPAMSASRESTTRQIYKAAETRSYLDATARPYIHLLDGGLTDNLGLRGMLDRVAAHDDPYDLARALRLGRFDKAVLIIVNAETSPDLALDRHEEVPTVVQVFRAIKDIPINRYSFETIELFKANLENWSRQLRAGADGEARAGFEFYLVEVTFDAIPDAAERDAFRAIPTSLVLPAETVDRLRALGPRLMRASEGYRRLRHDLAHGP
jgi:NTE family protein